MRQLIFILVLVTHNYVKWPEEMMYTGIVNCTRGEEDNQKQAYSRLGRKIGANKSAKAMHEVNAYQDNWSGVERRKPIKPSGAVGKSRISGAVADAAHQRLVDAEDGEEIQYVYLRDAPTTAEPVFDTIKPIGNDAGKTVAFCTNHTTPPFYQIHMLEKFGYGLKNNRANIGGIEHTVVKEDVASHGRDEESFHQPGILNRGVVCDDPSKVETHQVLIPQREGEKCLGCFDVELGPTDNVNDELKYREAPPFKNNKFAPAKYRAAPPSKSNKFAPATINKSNAVIDDDDGAEVNWLQLAKAILLSDKPEKHNESRCVTFEDVGTDFNDSATICGICDAVKERCYNRRATKRVKLICFKRHCIEDTSERCGCCKCATSSCLSDNDGCCYPRRYLRSPTFSLPYYCCAGSEPVSTETKSISLIPSLRCGNSVCDSDYFEKGKTALSNLFAEFKTCANGQPDFRKISLYAAKLKQHLQRLKMCTAIYARSQLLRQFRAYNHMVMEYLNDATAELNTVVYVAKDEIYKKCNKVADKDVINRILRSLARFGYALLSINASIKHLIENTDGKRLLFDLFTGPPTPVEWEYFLEKYRPSYEFRTANIPILLSVFIINAADLLLYQDVDAADHYNANIVTKLFRDAEALNQRLTFALRAGYLGFGTSAIFFNLKQNVHSIASAALRKSRVDCNFLESNLTQLGKLLEKLATISIEDVPQSVMESISRWGEIMIAIRQIRIGNRYTIMNSLRQFVQDQGYGDMIFDEPCEDWSLCNIAFLESFTTNEMNKLCDSLTNAK